MSSREEPESYVHADVAVGEVLLPCSCDVVAVGGALEPCGSTAVGAVGSLLTSPCFRKGLRAAVEGHELKTPETKHRPGLERLLETTHLELDGKLFVNTQQAPTWRANCRRFDPGGPWTDE